MTSRRDFLKVAAAGALGGLAMPAGVANADDEWELVHRYCIVRLGPEWNWYTNAAHGSVGVTDVRIEGRDLVVYTDFKEGEKILSATANIDHQLTAKGIFAGASGGGPLARFAIRSARDLPGYKAWTQIRPNGKCFDSNLDNLWITLVSMRKRS